VPRHVVQRARNYLATLETHQAALAESPQAQLPLGPAEAPRVDPLREAVDELEPDAMTPREALEALYKLKDL
jgi:DNA mismatch repair protein MutS